MAVGQLANYISDDFRGAVGLEVFLHAAKGDADHVAMMQLGSGAFFAEFEPEAVDEVDIFGPQAGRMRTEIEEDNILLIFENNFEG